MTSTILHRHTAHVHSTTTSQWHEDNSTDDVGSCTSGASTVMVSNISAGALLKRAAMNQSQEDLTDSLRRLYRLLGNDEQRIFLYDLEGATVRFPNASAGICENRLRGMELLFQNEEDKLSLRHAVEKLISYELHTRVEVVLSIGLPCSIEASGTLSIGTSSLEGEKFSQGSLDYSSSK